MASAAPTNNAVDHAVQPSLEPQDAGDLKKYPHTFQSASMFLVGVAAIAFGVVGFVASCALLPAAPAAALPVAITCAAAFMAGIRLLKEAKRARLAEHGLLPPHQPPHQTQVSHPHLTHPHPSRTNSHGS
jgi:hypothetical protein